MNFDFKLVVAVRRDLKLSKGKMAAQVAHAAVMCATRSRSSHPEWYRRWIGEGQKKVVVYVDTTEELLATYNAALSAKLPATLVRDAGHTEIPAGTLTVAGIGPGPEEKVDEITGHLKLV